MTRTLATALLLVSAVSGHAAEVVTDLFEHRWFDVEFIVFERLPVLDVNTPERLTFDQPRVWPANLELMGHFLDAAALPARWAGVQHICFGSDGRDQIDAMQLGLEPVRREPRRPARREATLSEPAELGSETILEETLGSETTSEEALGSETDSLEVDLAAAIAAYEARLFDASYRWRDDLTLIQAVKNINRRRHLRPILHRKWRQPVPPRNAPAPIYIQADITPTAPATRHGLAKIEGYIGLTVGRYLHFAPTLWYNADTVGLEPVPLPLTARTEPPAAASGYLQLQESRRMRSGEIHYIDHPKLGVIVRIDPVPIPEEITVAWKALYETDERDLESDSR